MVQNMEYIGYRIWDPHPATVVDGGEEIMYKLSVKNIPKIVSKASEDLPLPLIPVITVSELRGISTSIFFKL